MPPKELVTCSQRELAARLGIREDNLSRWLSGRRSWREDTLQEIAVRTGYSAGQIREALLERMRQKEGVQEFDACDKLRVS